MADEPRDLLTLAKLIALEPPAKRNRYSVHAGVPWELIEELRDRLRLEGWDVDEGLKRMVEIRAEHKARLDAEHKANTERNRAAIEATKRGL